MHVLTTFYVFRTANCSEIQNRKLSEQFAFWRRKNVTKILSKSIVIHILVYGVDNSILRNTCNLEINHLTFFPKQCCDCDPSELVDMIKAAKERITRVNQIKNINHQVSRNSMDSNILMASSRESSVVNLRKNISGKVLERGGT